ncbi:hypothetical protein BH23VER1_BH23VER1_05190 [soil metagenome]
MARSDRALAALVWVVVVVGSTVGAVGQTAGYVGDPIRYWEVEPDDEVAALRGRMAGGLVSLPEGRGKPLLAAVLGELGVPSESQVLVFSKTSEQNAFISPQSPRALYFSDDVYVGWVPGGRIEVGTTDAHLGAVFYMLDDRRVGGGGREFVRPEGCMSCHAGSNTREVPGFVVRSVFPDKSGHPILSAGTFLTTHESPLAERWGGWYVTGRHGFQRHMGNAIASESGGEVRLDREAGANVTDLSPYLDTAAYLQPTSDILALMILEHQVEMHNRFHRASYAVRQGLHRQEAMRELFGDEPTDAPVGSTLRILENHAEKILQHLLFCDEAPLEGGGIDSGGPFRAAFLANRRPGTDGRSLKDLQLLDRLFKYRCSYLIYSAAFDALPVPLKEHIFRRLHEILDGNDTTGEFDHLGTSERGKIKAILMATKPEFARAVVETGEPRSGGG